MTALAPSAAELKRRHDEASRQLSQINANPEPQKSASHYERIVEQDPDVDARICQSLGKIVYLIAPFSIDTVSPKIALRGTAPGLSWNADFPAEKPVNVFQRTFLLTVPVDRMNKTVEIKLVAYIQGKLQWQSGENVSIDLSKLHHFSVVKLKEASFKA